MRTEKSAPRVMIRIDRGFGTDKGPQDSTFYTRCLLEPFRKRKGEGLIKDFKASNGSRPLLI